eukprot:12996981-Alexandrium_andersonii.AAC.1
MPDARNRLKPDHALQRTWRWCWGLFMLLKQLRASSRAPRAHRKTPRRTENRSSAPECADGAPTRLRANQSD